MDQKKVKAASWFEKLRTGICETFEALENDYQGPLKDNPAGKFKRSSWTREVADDSDGGGGIT
ncbi:MAG: oxygen-dependent coproporphyrinogen oxidase, partial [Alphaproteobacteria bacterium]